MRAFVLLGFAFALVGCATSYKYSGQTYSSETEAIEAVRADVQHKVDLVPPLGAPIAGSALILTPSSAWCRQAVRTKGNVSDDAIHYVQSVIFYGFYGMAEATKRRNIFKSTNIEEFAQRDPMAHPGYDYMIWARLDGPDSAQWMISHGNEPGAAKQLFTSPTASPGDRITNFLKSLEEQVSR